MHEFIEFSTIYDKIMYTEMYTKFANSRCVIIIEGVLCITKLNKSNFLDWTHYIISSEC